MTTQNAILLLIWINTLVIVYGLGKILGAMRCFSLTTTGRRLVPV